jgi:hypothetical protein
VTIDLLPLAHFYGGGLFVASDAVPEVLAAVADWAPGLPASSTASIAILRLPDLPAVPAPLRGRSVGHVRFASTSACAEAEDLLAPIRRITRPLVDTVGELPIARIGAVHADPTQPMDVMCGATTLSELDGAGVDALIEVAGPQCDRPIAAVELRCLGGALAREARVPNAVGGRDAAWNLFVSARPWPAVPQERRSLVRSVIDAMSPWRGDVNLINFIGRANDRLDIPRSWTADQRRRLDRIRREVDPEGLLAHDANATRA